MNAEFGEAYLVEPYLIEIAENIRKPFRFSTIPCTDTRRRWIFRTGRYLYGNGRLFEGTTNFGTGLSKYPNSNLMKNDVTGIFKNKIENKGGIMYRIRLRTQHILNC